MDAETLFKALADETRLRTVRLLETRGELCVCELTHALGVSQPKMSRHLAALRDAELVSDRRDGLWVFYRIAPTLPDWARRVLHHTAAGVDGTEPFAGDQRRLRLMADTAARCRIDGSPAVTVGDAARVGGFPMVLAAREERSP